MLQIKFLCIGNHGIAEAAGFQRGKGVFLTPQAIDSVKVLGTDGRIRLAPDISLGIHEVSVVPFPAFTALSEDTILVIVVL